jgi:hypothetical protein
MMADKVFTNWDDAHSALRVRQPIERQRNARRPIEFRLDDLLKAA